MEQSSAEVSVAPANALDEVKHSADIVLDESNGNAVKTFIDRYLLGDRSKISRNISN